MNFAFLQVGKHIDRVLAKIMVHSIRESNENANIIQISDKDTPQIEGTSWIIRQEKDSRLMLFRMECYSKFLPEECVSLDTDIYVQKNLDHVMNEDFDIAVVRRDKAIATVYEDLTEDMPYNAGVIFCKNKQFWKDIVTEIKTMSKSRQSWFGDQIALGILVKSGKYKVKELDSSYNFSALNFQDDVSEKHIVHYKGKRKSWMAYKYQHLIDINVKVVND